jgi:hypothetical protein
MKQGNRSGPDNCKSISSELPAIVKEKRLSGLKLKRLDEVTIILTCISLFLNLNNVNIPGVF